MRKNNDCGIQNKAPGGRLTPRGRQSVVLVLTVLGCILGVIAATAISGICSEETESHRVMACDRSEEYSETEGREENLPEVSEQVSPQWLFYQSYGDTGAGNEEKEYLDTLVNCWTKGKISDNELSEQMEDYLRKKEREVSTINIQSSMLCLFPSAKEIPDYMAMLQQEGGIYDFIGLYTDGQTDEKGRILCYYWEAGVR